MSSGDGTPCGDLFAFGTALATIGATGVSAWGQRRRTTPAVPPPPPGARGPRAAADGNPGPGVRIWRRARSRHPVRRIHQVTGAEWFPGLDRQIVDYPAGQVQGHTLDRMFPGIGRLDNSFPGLGVNGPSFGESVDIGGPNLMQAIREGGPGTVIGLSEGAWSGRRPGGLAYDPAAPPRDQLSFATYGNPVAGIRSARAS